MLYYSYLNQLLEKLACEFLKYYYRYLFLYTNPMKCLFTVDSVSPHRANISYFTYLTKSNFSFSPSLIRAE